VTDSERFARFVNKAGPKHLATPCWLWTGAKNSRGYGVFSVAGRAFLAHRLAIGLHDRALMACHRCDVRACVNPEHLYAGTAKDNAGDMLARRSWEYAPERAAGIRRRPRPDVLP
jgi:hypothetical protein